jgi:hypothetical protein
VQTFSPKAKTGGKAPQILVPKAAELIRWDEWMWKELRDGGYLQEYIRREKATSVQRQRACARKMQGVQPKRKESELELKAAVPAREFFRWREVDPDFWADDGNLRLLKKDNPDLPIFVERHRPTTAFRKTYK